METYISRYVGKTKNNFIYTQDYTIFAVGAATYEYLKHNGVHVITYKTEWTPDFIKTIIEHTDIHFQK